MRKRSPLLSVSLARDATLEFGTESNMEIVTRGEMLGDQTFLCDLSAIRKRLVVGDGANSWLAEHLERVPENIFHTELLSDNAIAARIHRHQWVVIDGFRSTQYDELFTLPSGAYGDVLLLD